MSMNIHCSAIELVQVGTWDSELILYMNPAGKPDGGYKGVARRYLLWANGRQQNEINTAQTSRSQQTAADYWERHISVCAHAFEKSGRKLKFWIC